MAQVDSTLRQARGRRRLQIVAAVALALAAGLLTWALAKKGDGNSSSPRSTGITVSREGLEKFAASLDHAVYWAGPSSDVTYELTQSPDGRIYVRYLPKGVAVGAEKPYLTIGTYLHANAFAATQAVARKATRVRVGGGGVAFYTRGHPDNVYLAYPGSHYQIEVFDPSPGRAQHLVAAGLIRPISARGGVGSPAPTSAMSVSTSELKALGDSTTYPIYWVGTRKNVTYELTRTPDGRVYVRYLPPGMKVGEQRPVLTIGTYPLANAYRATATVAKERNSVRIAVEGGVAFYSRTHPTSVYLGRPGSPVQVEVFDPDAAEGHQLVASGQVRPIR